MYWLDWVMIGGISIIGAAIILSVWQYALTARHVGGQKIPLATARRTGSARQDLCQGAVWFGLLLVTASQAYRDVHRGAPAQSIMLSVAAVTAGAFVCGVYSGRLLLRRQCQLEAVQQRTLDRLSGKAEL